MSSSAGHHGHGAPQVEVGTAGPADYPEILAVVPQDWFFPQPHLLQLQIARMVDGGRFLVARTSDGRVVGTLGWDDQIAFGALYGKFLSVAPGERLQGIATALGTEFIETGLRLGARALFGDVPATSLVLPAVLLLPGVEEAGFVDDWHGLGVRSVIVKLDLSRAHETLAHLRSGKGLHFAQAAVP